MKNSFKFLRCFYEAAEFLPSKQRLILYDAVFAFVFDDKEPDLTGMTETTKAFFILIKLNITEGITDEE